MEGTAYEFDDSIFDHFRAWNVRSKKKNPTCLDFSKDGMLLFSASNVGMDRKKRQYSSLLVRKRNPVLPGEPPKYF